MSIITTGINIVATGVGPAINQIKRFGQALTQTQQNVNRFANQYNRSNRQVLKSSMNLSSALKRNWQNDFNAIMANNNKNQGKALKALEREYDRTFRNIGNKYQSMVMGSVALSMSGVGIMNTGQSILGASKVALDKARDFELVMKQIQFYGHRTSKEMETIQKQIMQMGYELPVTTSEIANSVLSAQKLGYDSVEDAIKMAREASKIQFMGLGKIDGEESLKYISQFRIMTGKAVDDVDQLTDKLSKTADVSAASIDSLWKTIQSSRTAFDSMGADVDTFLTLTGTMADRLTPRNAGMALNSFAGGVQMAEKAGRENRGTRGEYYNQLKNAIGGGLDDFNGDVLKYIESVAIKSKELWGEGSERKGNLQSMFGKSALDLFYAVDAAMKKTGKSMTAIREEIKKSGGHADAYMETIMNSSYGTEKKLEAIRDQFQILFGTAIRPVFNQILTGIEKVIGAINRFMVEHPKLTKFLGYGFGLTGLLLTATGASMLFVGGILAIYASLMNLFVQLARNTRVLNLLSSGFGSAGAMIKAQMLGPLAILGRSLIKITSITFFVWLAWKNDFFRMRTTFNEWHEAITKGLQKSQRMFKYYAEGSSTTLYRAFERNESKGGLENWVANTMTKAKMLWDGIKQIFKKHPMYDAWDTEKEHPFYTDGILDADTHTKLAHAGLLPIIEKLYQAKTMAVDFWRGFQSGLRDGVELLQWFLNPLIKVWTWVSNEILSIFQHFGYFENVNKGIGSQWEQWGSRLGYIVGSVIAIRVGLWGWLKALKLIASPFKLLGSLATKLVTTLGKLKNIGKIMGGVAKFAGRMLFPAPLRMLAGYGHNRIQQRRMRNAYSPIPNARPNIDPTTGRPNGQVTYQQPRNERERRRLERERMRADGSVRQGRNGASQVRHSRGLGRFKDMWLGRQYVPEQRVDSRGRTYHQIRTRQGGVMRSTAQGLVRGQHVRTGGGLQGVLRRYVGNQRGAIGGGGAGGARSGGTRALGGMARGMGRMGGTVGKGLLKGIGKVLKTGLGTVFKLGFRAIPFLGLALMAWDIISAVFTNWDAIKNGAVKAWEWIKNNGITFLGQAWDWVKEKAVQVWNWIKTDGVVLLGAFWNWLKLSAGVAWEWVKTKAVNIWNSIKDWITRKAGEAWEWIKTTASSTWETVKTGVATALTNMFQPIKDGWEATKKFITDNPITQTVKRVTSWVGDKLGMGDGSHRTGLWNVPKDGYQATLHNGEMVLTQREAQIMRSLVGSDNNSISQTLLGQNKPDISIASKMTTNKSIKPPSTTQQTSQAPSSGGGNTEIHFAPGAVQVQVANASASEMKKGAKQMFDEFKRMVELQNMKNYKPARPRMG